MKRLASSEIVSGDNARQNREEGLALKNRLRTPLGALGLCLLLALPSHSQTIHDTPDGDPLVYEDVVVVADEAEYEPERIQTDLAAVDRAHAAYLNDGELQLERPEEEIDLAPPREPPGWLAAIGRFLSALGPVFQVVFYIAAALVVLGILYFLFGEAIRLRFGGKKDAKIRTEDDVLADIRPDAAAARSLLEEADALARQGRFAEAVHLLLFRSIEDIQERVEGGVPTSLTAREIAGLGKLPERAKRGLKPIIMVVERSFFGGRAVDADGWQEARRSYEDFAFGEGWA